MSPSALYQANTLHSPTHIGKSDKSSFVAKNTQADHTIIKTYDASLNEHRLAQYGNPALFVTPDHKIELQETPIPTPAATQVLVHIRCTGICGSDIHLWRKGAIGPLTVGCSSILGHEASGVVLATGTEVTHLKKGDHVAIEPGVPCMTCFLCTAGKYNLCQSVAFAGVCPHAGTIRRFMVHPARYCHRMPEGMTFSQGALLEPLSVVLHAISQCKSTLAIGEPVLICGAGPIGLIALASARASGSWPLLITDIDQGRLDFAKRFVPGALAYQVSAKKSAIEVAEEIRSLFNCGKGSLQNDEPYTNEHNAPNTVLECTGVEDSIVTAAYSCRRAGTVMVVGVGGRTVNNLPFMHLSLGEIDLRFVNRYRDNWPAGINALANHQVLDLDALVTHVLPLEQAVSAMWLSTERMEHSIKVQIVDNLDIEI